MKSDLSKPIALGVGEEAMSDKKYVVPEGMLKAAIDAAWRSDDVSKEDIAPYVQILIEAAIRWQSENLKIPTTEWLDEFNRAGEIKPFKYFGQAMIAEWQRRMYLAPESEVPDGLVGISDKICLIATPAWRKADIDHALLAAYRLGQKAERDGR
jgi:hypothetical protein